MSFHNAPIIQDIFWPTTAIQIPSKSSQLSNNEIGIRSAFRSKRRSARTCRRGFGIRQTLMANKRRRLDITKFVPSLRTMRSIDTDIFVTQLNKRLVCVEKANCMPLTRDQLFRSVSQDNTGWLGPVFETLVMEGGRKFQTQKYCAMRSGLTSQTALAFMGKGS